jgi:hypothetical protein
LLVRAARGGVDVGPGAVEVGATVVLVLEVVVDAIVVVVGVGVGVVVWVTWSVAEMPTEPPPQRAPML